MAKVRNWRQRLDPTGNLVFRRATLWGDTEYQIGDPIPDDLRENKKKLNLLWESERIELADFEQPPGAVPRPEGEPASGQAAHQSATSPLPDNVEQRGSWFAVTMPDGTEQRVQGREALYELLAEIDA